jgi:iron-sulfur cluster assembly protein
MNDNIANIHITDSARTHIQKFLTTMDKEAGFRLGVKKSGCSGYAYIADVVAKLAENELLVEENGLRIFIDKNSIPVLKGTVIDLIDKGLSQKQLQFNNPNVEDSCGCGESFTVKADE